MKENYINFENEKEILNKVSDLIQEAKPLFYKQKRNKENLSRICAAFLFLFVSFTSFTFFSNSELMDTIKYGESLCAQDLGFPVDSYGLIMVDDEP